MVFWFSGFGPKSLIWPLLGLLAASVLTSHYRRMMLSRNHTNSQLILPKMRFMTTSFAFKLAQNPVWSSMQKTPLAAAKLIFCIFIDHKIDWNLMPLQGGYSGRPGPHPAPSGLEIGLAGGPSWPFLAVERVVILAASRSSHCMSLILSDVCRRIITSNITLVLLVFRSTFAVKKGSAGVREAFWINAIEVKPSQSMQSEFM